jgi:hypothetical protein
MSTQLATTTAPTANVSTTSRRRPTRVTNRLGNEALTRPADPVFLTFVVGVRSLAVATSVRLPAAGSASTG